VGDTRLYRLRGHQLQQLTVDHALDPGKLNLLTRAVGIDAIELPPSESSDVEGALSGKTIHGLPDVGSFIDGFRIDGMLSDSRYVRVFGATDLVDGRPVVMKFPKPLEGADRPMRDAFLREM